MMQRATRRPRALAAVLILSVLALGALAGIAIDRLVLLPRAGYAGEPAPVADSLRDGVRGEARGPHGGALTGRPSRDRYLRHLAAELELTEEQQERLGAILNHQQERVLEITRESRPRLRAVAADTREAIRGVLTEEQWVRFQEMRHRRDRREPPGDAGNGERVRDTAAARSSRSGS